MVMDDADAKEDNTFSDFTLARPREQNATVGNVPTIISQADMMVWNISQEL